MGDSCMETTWASAWLLNYTHPPYHLASGSQRSVRHLWRLPMQPCEEEDREIQKFLNFPTVSPYHSAAVVGCIGRSRRFARQAHPARTSSSRSPPPLPRAPSTTESGW